MEGEGVYNIICVYVTVIGGSSKEIRQKKEGEGDFFLRDVGISENEGGNIRTERE